MKVNLKFIPIFFTSLLLIGANKVTAQAADEVLDEEPISRSYESWSLFLICSHEWLLPENKNKIDNLYDQFIAFGEAIGPRNVAIWFRGDDANETAGRSEYYPNIARSVSYCQKFELLPSKSPYVLLLTQHPDDIHIGDKYKKSVIELSNASASEITHLLANLNDELFKMDIAKRKPNGWGFRRTFRKAFKIARANLNELADSIKVSFDTGIISVEVEDSD